VKILHRGYILNRQQLEAIAPTVLAYAQGQIRLEDFDAVADRAMANAGCPVPRDERPAPKQTIRFNKKWKKTRGAPM